MSFIIFNSISMGICTSDPLTYLIKEYGADVCKYIVSIKAEEFVDKKVPEIATNVQTQFKNTAGTLDKEFEARQNTITGQFKSTISSIKESNPNALEKAKQSQNKSEEQLLGYDSIKNQFSNLKAAKDSKIKDQESNILKLLQQKKGEIKQNLQSSRPSLPLLDSMPMCLKMRAISEAEEKFAPEIKDKQTQVSDIFDKITNLGDLEKNIKKVSGLGEADKLVKTSSSMFEKGKKMVSIINNPSAGMAACC